MKEYIEREAVLRPLKAKCDIMGTSQTYTAHAKEQAYWDAYTTVQQFPAAPVDELVNAARLALYTLRRCKEIVDALECECDEYHGYTCSIHHDREMVNEAINQAEAALAALGGGQ